MYKPIFIPRAKDFLALAHVTDLTTKSPTAKADIIVATFPWRPGDSDPHGDIAIGNIPFRLMWPTDPAMTYDRYIGFGTRALNARTTDLRRDGDVIVRLPPMPLEARDPRQAKALF
jgi:hypothetical protein